MFRHLMKGLPWQLGPVPLLLFLLIIVRINSSAAAKPTASSEINVSTSTPDYDSDDDGTPPPSAPGEQTLPKGPQPFFEKPTQTIYLGSNNKTQINCSAKNFDDAKYNILWYKGKIMLFNGNHSMTNGYQLDAKMNLIIDPVTKDTPGNYICEIAPGKIRQTTIVKAGEGSNSKSSGGIDKNLPIFVFTALFSVYLAQLLYI